MNYSDCYTDETKFVLSCTEKVAFISFLFVIHTSIWIKRCGGMQNRTFEVQLSIAVMHFLFVKL